MSGFKPEAEVKLSEFREKVYAAVRKIPAGKVASYGAIAEMIGRPGAARAVGTALHFNPYEWGNENVPEELWVPCHRVVAKDGSLAKDFGFGGAEEQKARLTAEGVEIEGERALKKFMSEKTWSVEDE